MQTPLLPHAAASCCFVAPPARLEETAVSDLLDRLQTLARALNAQQLALHNHVAEEQRDAIRAKERGDLEGALSHVRVAQRVRAEREALLKKRENLLTLAARLKGAHDTAVALGVLRDSSATLEGLVNATDGLEDVMDELRSHLERVEEDARALAAPLREEEEEEEPVPPFLPSSLPSAPPPLPSPPSALPARVALLE